MEIAIYFDGNGTVTIDYPDWMTVTEALMRVYEMFNNQVNGRK